MANSPVTEIWAELGEIGTVLCSLKALRALRRTRQALVSAAKHLFEGRIAPVKPS